MANPLYKTAVRELEAVLPPRVVSQSLHEGLVALGKTAETLSYGDAERILRDRVLPRLTPTLGAARAEAALHEILGRLSGVPELTPALSLGAQAQALALLQAALKPFNIYFEWSETQKFRAQLSLIEAEHAAGRGAGELIAAAQVQLGVLQQKLSDQLSVQARELTILEAAVEDSAALKSPKVRRLAGLLDLVRGAQAAGQRAPAEVERAHRLAGELRAEKLRLLGDEARELHGLEEGFSTLLALEPALAERLGAHEQAVQGGALLGETLPAFRAELETAQETLRTGLEGEFRALGEGREGPSPELAQLLVLSLKVLETTLPPAADVQRVRDLVRAGASDADGLADFHRLEDEAEGYRELPGELGDELRGFLAAARGALEHTLSLPDLTRGWELVRRAQAERARSARSFVGRLEAAKTAAAPLAALNSEAAAELRWRLGTLGAQEEAVQRVSPKRQAELEAALCETEALIASLQDEATATRAVAAQLMECGALDAALGFPNAPQVVQAQEPASPAPPPALQGWLERQADHEGVAGIALFTDEGALVAGELPTDARTLQRAVRLGKRRADALGAGLDQGAATSLSVETPEHTLVAFWLDRARSLVVVTRAPTWGGAARQRLEDALPELAVLLAA